MKNLNVEQNEYQLIKQDKLLARDNYVVTFAQGNVNCKIDGVSTKLGEGTVLGVNSVIQTNDGRAEVRSISGAIFRLGSQSEFEIKQTVEGKVPVYYGNVYVNTAFSESPISGGKYRTSCYTQTHIQGVLTTRISDDSDCYYSLDGAVEIYEYDESGRKFQIAHLEPFQALTLKFNDTLKMRSRYLVTSRKDLSKQKIDELYTNYVVPTTWMG
jgi:hypothetical protein